MAPMAQYPMFLGMGDRGILKVPNSKHGALNQEVMLEQGPEDASKLGRQRTAGGVFIRWKVSHSNLGPIM